MCLSDIVQLSIFWCSELKETCALRYISPLAAGARMFCYQIFFMPLPKCLFLNILPLWFRCWKFLLRALVTQIYVLSPSWPVWYSESFQMNVIHLEISELLSFYIWSFAKLLIFFDKGMGRLILELNWKLEIWFNLSFWHCPENWRTLSKAPQPVNCRTENLTQTTRLGLVLFLPHHAASHQN